MPGASCPVSSLGGTERVLGALVPPENIGTWLKSHPRCADLSTRRLQLPRMPIWAHILFGNASLRHTRGRWQADLPKQLVDATPGLTFGEANMAHSPVATAWSYWAGDRRLATGNGHQRQVPASGTAALALFRQLPKPRHKLQSTSIANSAIWSSSFAKAPTQSRRNPRPAGGRQNDVRRPHARSRPPDHRRSARRSRRHGPLAVASGRPTVRRRSAGGYCRGVVRSPHQQRPEAGGHMAFTAFKRRRSEEISSSSCAGSRATIASVSAAMPGVGREVRRLGRGRERVELS